MNNMGQIPNLGPGPFSALNQTAVNNAGANAASLYKSRKAEQSNGQDDEKEMDLQTLFKSLMSKRNVKEATESTHDKGNNFLA